MTHPNTVAHSSGAVCCPDEASARRHRDRATWWERMRHWPFYGYDGQWIGSTITPAERRWTR